MYSQSIAQRLDKGSPLPPVRSRGWTYAALAFAVAVPALTYWRLYYGVDLTDESYYVAVSYRFVLGAQPFIDEATLSQAGLFAYPFIALYDAVVGTEGIVLFTRHLHFLFSCSIAACVFACLRPFVRTKTEALLASLLPIAFVPFNIHNLSYNTLGSGFFVAGCFVGVTFLAQERRAVLAAAGLLHGVAVFAYPPLIVPVIVYVGGIALLRRGRAQTVLLPYLLFLLVPVAALVLLVFTAGVDNLQEIVSRAREFGEQGGGSEKAYNVTRGVVETTLRTPLGILAVTAILALWRLRPNIALYLLAITPLLVIPLRNPGHYAFSLLYITTYGLLALPLFFLLRSNRSNRELFLAIWPAALVGGFVTAWSSHNAAINFGVGFLPAAIVTTVLLAEAIRQARVRSGRADQPSLATFVGAGGVLAVVLALQFTSVYRDSDIHRLDVRVTSGPYAGIYTTREKQRFLGALTDDLRRLAPRSCRILFYDEFPAGYLISSSSAYTNAVWLMHVEEPKIVAYRRILLGYYDRNGGLPDVVVRMSEVPTSTGSGFRLEYAQNDPLDQIVRRSPMYRSAIVKAAYGIYYRRGATCLRG